MVDDPYVLLFHKSELCVDVMTALEVTESSYTMCGRQSLCRALLLFLVLNLFEQACLQGCEKKINR